MGDGDVVVIKIEGLGGLLAVINELVDGEVTEFDNFDVSESFFCEGVGVGEEASFFFFVVEIETVER